MKNRIYFIVLLMTISTSNFSNNSDTYFGKTTKLTDYFDIKTEDDLTKFTVTISELELSNIQKLNKIAKSTEVIEIERGGLTPVKKKKKKKKDGLFKKISNRIGSIFFQKKNLEYPEPVYSPEAKNNMKKTDGHVTAKQAISRLGGLQNDYKDQPAKRILPMRALTGLLSELSGTGFGLNYEIVDTIKIPRTINELKLLIPLIQLPTQHKQEDIRRLLIYKVIQGCDERENILKKINSFCQMTVRHILLNILNEKKVDQGLVIAANEGLKTLDKVQFKVLNQLKLEFKNRLSGPVYNDSCKLPIMATKPGEHNAPSECSYNPYINTDFDKELQVHRPINQDNNPPKTDSK